MKFKTICIFLCFALLWGMFTVTAYAQTSQSPLTMADAIPVAGEALTVDVPISVDFTDALGVNLNIRLHLALVDKAVLVNPAECLGNTMYTANQTGDKFKVAIATGDPISHSGVLFYLRLTLKQQAAETDELCKLLQVKINDVITWQASDRVLIAGVTDGAVYRDSVTVVFNEGTATLNGVSFASGDTVTAEGTYTLSVRDSGAKVRTVTFTIDRTVISVDVSFEEMSFVYDQGVWNDETHQYENGSWQALNGGGNLTVTNGSNVPVAVVFAYEANEGFETIDVRFIKDQAAVNEEELAIGEVLTVAVQPIGVPETSFSQAALGNIVITIIKKTETVGYHE
ncbi:MAG: hypothetical protein IJW46_02225 [Clostridia bacterium]|nr:hypothetical protein [Clostridia bacterium]